MEIELRIEEYIPDTLAEDGPNHAMVHRITERQSKFLECGGRIMIDGVFTNLREFTFLSVLLRLGLAMVAGGMLGIERARKQRAAGFRTYMIVCLSSTLTMLIGQYLAMMLSGAWAVDAALTGASTDVSRLGSQVINGIGFLGAGTIIINGRQQIKGLTTAAGLWASACMGLAIGAGFFECVIVSFLLILLSVCFLPTLENTMVSHSRNLNIYLECCSLGDIGVAVQALKHMGISIYDLDISSDHEEKLSRASANFSLQIQKGTDREKIVSALSEQDGILLIDEM